MRSTTRCRGGDPLTAAAVAAAAVCVACAPALNWRDVRPADSGVQLQFPCKPHAQQRSVPLAGAPVTLTLYACAAGEQTWGLGYADVSDPARVGTALAELRASAAVNLGAAAGPGAALLPAGATPQAASQRQRLHGKLPSGEAVQMEVAVFARGTQVFQASVLGARLPDEAVETYIASISFPP